MRDNQRRVSDRKLVICYRGLQMEICYGEDGWGDDL